MNELESYLGMILKEVDNIMDNVFRIRKVVMNLRREVLKMGSKEKKRSNKVGGLKK